MTAKLKPLKIVDLFCGAGGTSDGLVSACKALGYTPHITAVNHWDVAIATHELNHGEANHINDSIENINPRHHFKEREVDILWASPECTNHSRAKGGRSLKDQSRATAHCVTRWAEALLPKIILVENVPEFMDWGPLIEKTVFDKKSGKNIKKLVPDPNKKGETFQAWVTMLKSLGYKVNWCILTAADYGDPTSRQRFFLQAVRSGRKVVFPYPTHAKQPGTTIYGSKTLPWRTARECIDLEYKSTSIFKRKTPLSNNTMKRIWAGLAKYGLKAFITTNFGERPTQDPRTHSLDTPLPAVTSRGAGNLIQPFIVTWDNTSSKSGEASIDSPLSTIVTKARHGVAQPKLIELDKMLIPQQSCGTAKPIDNPSPTVATSGAIGLAEPYLIESNFGGNPERRISSIDDPLKTVLGSNVHALIQPYLVSYYGNGQPLNIDEPLDTVTTKERFGLVQPIFKIAGKHYLLDIHYRMLQPFELALAQGFRPDYQFTGTKTDQTKQIGNAVPRNLSRALALAALTQNPDISKFTKPKPQAA